MSVEAIQALTASLDSVLRGALGLPPSGAGPPAEDAVRVAVLAEREACARVLEAIAAEDEAEGSDRIAGVLRQAAASVRTREEP